MKRYSKSPEVCYLFDRVPALHLYKTDGFCQYAVLSDGKVIEVDLARKNSGEVIAVARHAHVFDCYDECETPS